MTRLDEEAKLYLENALVKRIEKAQYDYRVEVTVERQNRRGETMTRWFTLWWKGDPPFEVGSRISASGYFAAKAYLNGDGQPRCSIEMSAPRLLSEVPAEGAADDPWGSHEGWGD